MDLSKRMQELFGTGGKLCVEAELSLRHLVPDEKGGVISQDGVRCKEIKKDKRTARRCVTDAFVALLVDTLQASQAAFSTFKYHDSGTGTVAEAATDTILGTPCAEARDAGTQIEGATSNIYKSVATHTYAAAFAITEHGLFNAVTAGTLMDRSVFAAVNVANTEKIEFTYQLTVNAGG